MKAIAAFLVVAFGFSAAVGLALFVAAPESPLVRVGFQALFMFGPALGALVARRMAPAALGALVPPMRVAGSGRWWLVAWLAPPVVAFAALFVGACMPGVELVFDAAVVLERFGDAIPPDKLAEARAELARIPPLALLLLQLVQALIAGISINMVAAFGEELGWRGFLHVHLSPRLPSLWRRAFVVGALWGAWHAPLILQGHNYPQHPIVGVVMMIVFCVLLAPWFEHVREKTGSVLAASVMHGTINASAGFAILFLRGGNDLLVGLTGLAGFIVLSAANVVLLALLRRAPPRNV
jgi:membrane protease YdiL (CAAX protease family)